MSSHALSFSKNPDFKSFIEAVCSNDSITLVLGAGVSIESGLPTWSGLLEILGRRIETPCLYDLITAEEADPSRRASLILSALSEDSGLADLDWIRHVFYTKVPKPKGALLISLAKLIQVLGSRVKIITLNYDDCLEETLVNSGGFQAIEVRPFGLREVDDWARCESGVAILHIHGFVARKRKSEDEDAFQWLDREPLILSEGEYIEHGAIVQDIIRKQAESSHLVFVGTSLSDANITHPLSGSYGRLSTKGRIQSAFALLVPDDQSAIAVYQNLRNAGDCGSASVQQLSETCFKAKREHIEGTYGITVVRLNSYSQVAQAIAEAHLAVANRERYLDDSDKSSLRYGKRFKRIMGDIYSRFGVEPGGVAPGGEFSRKLSDELERILVESITPRLDEFRKKFVEEHVKAKRMWPMTKKKKRNLVEELSDENFGLYLWLRSALDDADGDEFEVFIAGSSSYSRRNGAIMAQRSIVSLRSIYASARSVFLGGAEVSGRPYQSDAYEHPGEALDRPWNMYWAVPIAISEAGVPLAEGHRVTVGAIVLQSSAFFVSDEEEFCPGTHSIMNLVQANPGMSEALGELLSEAGRNLASQFSVHSSMC